MWNNSLAYQRANYSKYWGKPDQIKDRAKRNAARRELEKEWRVSKWDWKHVDHKKPLSQWGGNWKANLRVISAKKNKQLWAAIANKKKAKKKKQ